MRRLLAALITAAALAVPAAGHPTAVNRPDVEWREIVVDADQSFRGLDAVDRRTAWVTGGSVSGGPGGVFRTEDAGATWQDVSPPDAAGLLFRDVEVTRPGTAVVLAIGEGEASRVYRTTDNGESWTESFRNRDPAAFYNCVDFYRGGRVGLVVSDPVEGRFRILRTDDGGASWRVLPSGGMPDSTGEFNFAASGDCLVISGRTAHVGTGGSAARVFTSSDRGLTWTATDSTIPPGEAAGVFGLAFQGRSGVAVGGDFLEPADGVDVTAYRTRGGDWRNGGDLGHLAEDAAFLPRTRGLLLATGESGDVAGTSWSWNGGRTWRPLSETGYHTLDCTRRSCWAAGGGGRVAVASLPRRR